MLRFKSPLLCVCALILLLLFTSARAQYQNEQIYNFTSNIVVNLDASIDVTENISVYANQNRIVHGIVRHLPTRYVDSYGIAHHTQYRIQRILMNNADSTYHLQHDMGQLSIYIGDRDTLLAPGDYTYTIQYHVNNAINFLRDADELYWNVTGNNWDFPIERAQANIQLPDSAVIENGYGYTGVLGSKGQDYVTSKSDANQITFTTTRPLQPGEGLTIAADWQKGIINPPTWAQWIKGQLLPEDYLLIELTIVLLGYYIIVCKLYAKQPPKGTVIPLFEPPANLTPEGMRFIVRMGADVKTFTTAIINMATGGYLKIENNNDTFTLIQQGKSVDTLPYEEKSVAMKLFADTPTLTLSSSNNSSIRKARSDLNSNLRNQYQKENFITNSIYLIPGIIFTLFAVGAAIHSADDPAAAASAIGWLSIWTIACFVMFAQLIYKIEEAKASGSFAKIAGATFSCIVLIPFLIGEIVGIYIFSAAIPIFTLPMLFLIAIINYFSYHLLRVPTVKGRSLLDQIEGFKLYLATTERYRLDQLNPPKQTPELFEKYLPYAIALDVENQWGEQFNDVLTQAGKETQTTTYQPSWYSGGGWSTTSLAAMPLFIGSAISTSVISSSSSASGGGGFSGGGGGGGGGGGW